MNSPWAVPLLLAAVVFACFSPSLSADFVNWDDDANFVENPQYRGGWGTVWSLAELEESSGQRGKRPCDAS